MVIIDNAEENSSLLAMSGDGNDDVNISSLFINKVLSGNWFLSIFFVLAYVLNLIFLMKSTLQSSTRKDL